MEIDRESGQDVGRRSVAVAGARVKDREVEIELELFDHPHADVGIEYVVPVESGLGSRAERLLPADGPVDGAREAALIQQQPTGAPWGVALLVQASVDRGAAKQRPQVASIGVDPPVPIAGIDGRRTARRRHGWKRRGVVIGWRPRRAGHRARAGRKAGLRRGGRRRFYGLSSSGSGDKDRGGHRKQDVLRSDQRVERSHPKRLAGRGLDAYLERGYCSSAAVMQAMLRAVTCELQSGLWTPGFARGAVGT